MKGSSNVIVIAKSFRIRFTVTRNIFYKTLWQSTGKLTKLLISPDQDGALQAGIFIRFGMGTPAKVKNIQALYSNRHLCQHAFKLVCANKKLHQPLTGNYSLSPSPDFRQCLYQCAMNFPHFLSHRQNRQ